MNNNFTTQIVRLLEIYLVIFEQLSKEEATRFAQYLGR